MLAVTWFLKYVNAMHLLGSEDFKLSNYDDIQLRKSGIFRKWIKINVVQNKTAPPTKSIFKSLGLFR